MSVGQELVPLQITVTEFQIILGLIFTSGGAFAAWLYRHERWFRNMVFPVIQALTGKDPRGTQVDSTDDGHFQETENRLQRIENDLNEIEEQVGELQRRQDRHNQQTTRYLRRVVAKVEGIDHSDVDDALYRGDGDPSTDGGREHGSDGGTPGDD